MIVPGADEAGVHVVAVGERVAGEQLQVPQVRPVRRARQARVVRAVLKRWAVSLIFAVCHCVGVGKTCMVT